MDRSRPMTGIPVVGSQTVFNGQMPVMMGQMIIRIWFTLDSLLWVWECKCNRE